MYAVGSPDGDRPNNIAAIVIPIVIVVAVVAAIIPILVGTVMWCQKVKKKRDLKVFSQLSQL